MRIMIGTMLLATTMALPLVAVAQGVPPVPSQPPPLGNNESQVPPGRIQAPGGNTTNSLSKSNGTITPPDVDPGLAAKPPAVGGAMPVIPPPGTDGKGNVQPR